MGLCSQPMSRIDADNIAHSGSSPSDASKPLWVYHLLALCTITIWSFSFLFIVWVNEFLTPAGVVVGRKLIFGVFVLALLVWRRPNVRGLSLRDWAIVVVVAIVAGPMYHLIFAWSAGQTASGEPRIDTALLGLIIATVPVHTAWLARLFLGERMHFIKIIALVLGLGGVALVILGRYGRIDLLPREHLEGPIGVTIAAIVGGGIAVCTRAARKVYGPFDLVAVSGVLIVLMCAAFAPIAEMHRFASMPAIGWVGIGFLGLFGSGVAFVTWATALRGLQAATAATYLFMASVLGAIWAWIFRGQTIGWPFVPGAVMVFAGLLLMARYARSEITLRDACKAIVPRRRVTEKKM